MASPVAVKRGGVWTTSPNNFESVYVKRAGVWQSCPVQGGDPGGSIQMYVKLTGAWRRTGDQY